MNSFFKSKPENPPSRNQIVLCERLGLDVTVSMSRGEVSRLLNDSLQKEKYKKIYDEIQKEKEAEFENEDRALYGNDLYDELKKWEQYCDPHKQYILIYKRGGEIKSEIAEFETAEIIGERKYSIQLRVLLPKLRKEKDIGDYLEWKKEVTLKPTHVLKIEPLSESIDIFDIETYSATKSRAESIASEFIA